MKSIFLTRAIKLLRLLSSGKYRAGLRFRTAAAIEHESAMRALRLGSLLDLGANTGQFSLLMRGLHPGLVIHAFEPVPQTADRYARLFGRDSLVHLHRLAAGETEGTAEIHISGHPDSSSLLPITQLQDTLFPGTAEASVQAIAVRRVDDVLRDTMLPEPMLIKLDVQGFELPALRGMPQLLERASHVYCEVSFKELYEGQALAHEIIAWLAERKFQVAGVHNLVEAADGSTIQADMLFTRIAA